MAFKKIVNKYRYIRKWRWIVWHSKDKTTPLPAKIFYALKGFSADECVWYDLAHNDYREYISEFERLNSREINGKYKFVLDDKLVFEDVVGQFTNVPANYAWISDGTVYGLHDNGMNNDNLIEYLAKFKTTVLKWNERGGGAGTYVIDYKDGRFDVNGEDYSEDALKELFSRDGSAILCQYITQSEFSASLYPYTTNTIRIVVAKKKGESKAQFVIASQRVGCKNTIPVDNASMGGMVIPIDAETGELGIGMIKCGIKERIRVPYESHPDTGVRFTGRKIPNWENIVKEIVDLTNKLPYLNFVAWDVLLTDDGYSIIEGNASSGTELFQMEHGIRNSLLGEIYKSYGIIK